MKKTYVKADINITVFKNTDIINASSVNKLNYGGNSGKSSSESFSSMFGDK